MDAFFHFLGTLVICTACLIGLTIILIAVLCCLPNSPLRGVLAAITKRITATAAITAVGIPLESIPGIDACYDTVGLIFLVFYWFGMFKEIRTALQPSPSPIINTKLEAEKHIEADPYK